MCATWKLLKFRRNENDNHDYVKEMFNVSDNFIWKLRDTYRKRTLR